MERSHRKKHLQQQTNRNMLLALGGIVALIAFLFIFGTDILIGFATLLNNLKGKDPTQITKDEAHYIAPPVLNSMNEATNSAEIIVSGYADKQQQIKLYVNGKLAEKTTAKDNNSFTFKKVTLTKGNNDIKAKVVTANEKESDYSDTLQISYLDKEPKLELETPSDGQTFAKSDSPITIKGKTDKRARVTVNDLWTITQDDGKFSYQYNLQDGDNHLKIIATDEAGNKASKEITIKVQ